MPEAGHFSKVGAEAEATNLILLEAKAEAKATNLILLEAEAEAKETNFSFSGSRSLWNFLILSNNIIEMFTKFYLFKWNLKRK